MKKQLDDAILQLTSSQKKIEWLQQEGEELRRAYFKASATKSVMEDCNDMKNTCFMSLQSSITLFVALKV
jgi:hypothetical protein